jgi:sugar lactone lactonase YvrE
MPTTNPEIPRRNAALVADGFKFLEGPRWRDGRLYFSDIFDHKVYALEPGGARSVIVEVPGEPSGLGWSREGDLMIASMLDRRLSRLRNGELELVADLSGHFAHEVNDIHVDAAGRAWVGSFGFHLGPGATARPTDLLRVDPDGTVTVAAGGLLFPNGVASTPHGTLLVAETFGYRITEFDIAADGSLSNRRPWATFRDQPATEHDLWLRDDCIHPDGIALDEEGALWVADARGGGAFRVKPGGEVVEQVEVDDARTAYSVALGGPDGKTLYLVGAPPIGAGDPRQGWTAAVWQIRVEHAGVG